MVRGIYNNFDYRALGLSVTYSIIERHGGYIDVDSHLGEGTTFTVAVPINNKRRNEHDEAV